MTKLILTTTFLLLFLYGTTMASVAQKESRLLKLDKRWSVKIGVLIKNVPKGLDNPSEYVLEDGYLYQGADYRIGRTNIVLKNQKNIQDLIGKIVVIYYTDKQNLYSIVKKKSKAPENYGREESMTQIRSDWVADETGFSVGHSTKERLQKINYHLVEKIEFYPGLNLQSRQQQVQVKWQNLFENPMTNVKIIAHYEGGIGKPSPRYIAKSFKTLNRAAIITAEFPVMKSENSNYKRRKSSFRLESIIVTGQLGKNGFKIDLGVYGLLRKETDKRKS